MKRRWKRNWKKTVSHKVFARIMLVLLIAFALYGTTVTYAVYQNILRTNYDSLDGMLESNAENIRQFFEMINGSTIALSGSDAIVNWREDNDYFSSGDKAAYLHIEKLNKDIQRVLIYNNVWNFDLFDYVAIVEGHKLLAYTYTKSYSTQLIIDSSQEIYEQIAEDEDYNQTIAPTVENPTIYTTLKIQSDFSGDRSVYVIGATSAAALNEKISTIATYKDSIVYLVDQEGTVYATNQENTLGTQVSERLLKAAGNQKSMIKVDGKKYEVIEKKINNDYSIIYMFPKQEIMRQTLLGMESLIIISIIITLIMAAVLTMMEANYEARILEDEAEIKFLQQQMNPHFLFNILLTIQIKAKMSGDEAVYRMISSLSSLLRAGIYGDKRAVITVAEELKYVEYYLSLQKERYEDRLTYEIEIADETLLDCEVPRLSIEPLVENAIIHGVEEVDHDAYVKVRIISAGKDLEVHVIDNGSGFDPDSMNLEGTDVTENGETREKVGIRSTLRRIKLLYGNAYGIEVKSEIGKGTDIIVRLPKQVKK